MSIGMLGGMMGPMTELEAVTAPTLILQGERDTFGTPKFFVQRRDARVGSRNHR